MILLIDDRGAAITKSAVNADGQASLRNAAEVRCFRQGNEAGTKGEYPPYCHILWSAINKTVFLPRSA